MENVNRIVPRDGYLVDSGTGEKILFYECDPENNTGCEQKICRSKSEDDDGSFGFCSKTLDPRFRKENGRAWYAVLKTPNDGGEPYWGREYVEV